MTTESDKNRKAEEAYAKFILKHDGIYDAMGNAEFNLMHTLFLAGYEAGQKDWAPVIELVNEQAEDEGLWAVPALGIQSAMEAYLQQELRKLHALIESIQPPKEMKND